MKNICLLLVLIWIQICSDAWGNSQFSCLLQFDKGSLCVNDTIDHNIHKSIVSLSDLTLTNVDNLTSLPYKYLLISVPFNSKDYTLKIDKIKTTTIPINYPVIRGHDYEYSSIANEYETNTCRDSGINVAATAQIIDTGIMRGFNRVVSVVVYPVGYSESNLRLDLIEECRLELNWTIDDSLWNEAIIPGHDKTVNISVNDVKALVTNPESVELYHKQLKQKQRASLPQESDYFQYIIVTSKQFRNCFDRLIALRKLRGISTSIFYIEDILSDNRFKDGDLISGLNDSAGKLRAFLTYAYKNYGTEYVLLAGKYPDMPVRMVRYTKSNNGKTDTIRYTSDIYFGELNASWNKTDETGATLESSVLGNNSYELKIGRLTFSSKKEIDAYVDKLFYYELNPGKGDIDYLGNAFISVSKEMKDGYLSSNQRMYRQAYSTLRELFQTASDYPTGHDVIESLNSQQWGYVDFQGHGNPQGVQTTDEYDDGKPYRWYGINALDKERRSLVDENQNGLDNWNNKYYPNWSISMSCTLSPFIHDREFTYTFADSYLL